jgi:hypothetical protein
MLYKEYIDHEVHTNMDIYPIWIAYLEINGQKDWKLMVKKLNGSFFFPNENLFNIILMI